MNGANGASLPYKFCAESYGILTLWGGFCHGKIMALHATVIEQIGRGVAAVYIIAFSLISHIRPALKT